MRWLWRWIKRAFLAVAVTIALLLSPVLYTEIACTGSPDFARAAEPIITDAEWQRAESRTLTTYPEWHIVHAYDDYARVLQDGDPHEFGFLRAIAGFWTSLCPLKAQADALGGMTAESKMTIYTIGVSFTAELLAKAAYEETLGRLTTWVRGETRAPLDELSAAQAAAYAEFLQQVPWYKWDFRHDALELRRAATDVPRDRERVLALGLEYRAKAAYAGVIAQAVEGIGADQLRLRSIVSGLSADALTAVEGVTVIALREEGVEIETDRYRAFTRVLERLAAADADIVEIAGNRRILFTAISDRPSEAGALYSFQRQGYGDWRHLFFVPVTELADRLRSLDGMRLEHVHDY
jgi:hypothetical protein